LATQKQIEANRKNAKLSTGPKTAKGKARVSKNAIRHGVWSINPVVNERRTATYETGAIRRTVEWKTEVDENQRYACRLETLIEKKENELQTCQDPNSRSQLQATIKQWRREACHTPCPSTLPSP
jgi:hypothetical protein